MTMEERLDETLFKQKDAFTSPSIALEGLCWMAFSSGVGLVKAPADCAVLMAGLPGPLSTFLTKKLTEHGVSRERFLFCEYF